jgi:hypothetical protein
MNTPTPLGKTYEQYEKELKAFKEYNLSKVEKVELANVPELLKEAKKAKQLITKAKIALKELKAQSITAADAIDNFANGPYFEITQNVSKIKKQAKELGLDVPKELDTAFEMVSKARGELGNGRSSKWFAALKSL